MVQHLRGTILFIFVTFCFETWCIPISRELNNRGHSKINFDGRNLRLTNQKQLRKPLQRSYNGPPSSFEDIEKIYKTQEAIKYLDEFIGYAENVNNNPDARTHLEELRNRELQRLAHMSVSQIKEYITSIRQALQSHVTGNRHLISINGHTFSLDHVSDWCCNFGR